MKAQSLPGGDESAAVVTNLGLVKMRMGKEFEASEHFQEALGEHRAVVVVLDMGSRRLAAQVRSRVVVQEVIDVAVQTGTVTSRRDRATAGIFRQTSHLAIDAEKDRSRRRHALVDLAGYGVPVLAWSEDDQGRPTVVIQSWHQLAIDRPREVNRVQPFLAHTTLQVLA